MLIITSDKLQANISTHLLSILSLPSRKFGKQTFALCPVLKLLGFG